MNDDLRTRMRDILLKSYMHMDVGAFACSMCQKSGAPLAFHVIEKQFDQNERELPYDQGFVNFRSSVGYIRGAFPLCASCAPPCKKCKLPTDPPSVHRFAKSVQGRIGLGICIDHIHWRNVIEGLAEWLLCRYWSFWAHPNSVLIRQAVDMGWLSAGVLKTDGCRNTKLFRGSMICVVWYRENNIELISLPAPRRFKDFVELERWLAIPKAKLLRDFMEADAEALREDDRHREAELGTEARYFQDVNDIIRTMGDKGDLALYAQLNPDFMKATMEVCEVGFECAVPASHVGGFIADAAASYQSDPNLAISCLVHTRNRIPQLWPEVREPAVQNLLAQLMDKEGKT